MNTNFPYQYDYRGATATSDYEKHIKDLIEQVLFTAPGERLNRPSFGCGLKQLLYQPNSEELAATTQYLIQGSLQQWLGELIEVQSVAVETQGPTLQIIIKYTIQLTKKEEVATFTKL